MIGIQIVESPLEGAAAIILNPNQEFFSSRVLCYLVADFLRFTAGVPVSIGSLYPSRELPNNFVNYDEHVIVVPPSLVESVEYALGAMESATGIQTMSLSEYMLHTGTIPGMLEQCLLGEATRFVTLHLDEFPDDILRLGKMPVTGDPDFLEKLGAWQIGLLPDSVINIVLRAIEHDGEEYTRAEKIPIADFIDMYYLLREGDSCLTRFPQPPTGV